MEKYNKALIALIAGLIAVANLFSPGLATGAENEDIIRLVVSILTPLLVWLVPNKPADA
jgi:hypothetical protein